MTGAGGLRLPRHRATTAQLCVLYPFQAEAGLGHRGVFIGHDRLAGYGPFFFDPFEAYSVGQVTNPNVLLLGEPGAGKSAAAKCLLARVVAVLGRRQRRWVAICDPKGEYAPLAEVLGLATIKLHPGGSCRINPLDAGPAGGADPGALAARRTTVVAALLGQLLRRDLAPLEDAAVGWAVAELARCRAPTLADLARLVEHPSTTMAERAGLAAGELARGLDAVRYGLGKLLDRDLRGMFDGRTTVAIDWSGPGVVVDLSAVHHDPAVLALVMVAATGWLQAVMASGGGDGPRRLQVIDEAWALLASERTARYLQATWKLCRAYGVANIAIAHRVSDLRSQADDGTATAKVAAGLLADTQTRVLFRQAADQADEARHLLGLTGTQARLLTGLPRGTALWKVAGVTALVDHVIGETDVAICNTDTRLLV
jgi:hypothetical protein